MLNERVRKFKKVRHVMIPHYLISIGVAVTVLLIALFISSVTVPIPQIVSIIISRITGWQLIEDIPTNIEMMIADIRFPRVLLAFLVGAGLALSGAAFQGLLRNPLADPFTIGVSSGAALAAVAVLSFNITLLGTYTLPIFGIVGGFVTLLIVFSITHLSGRGLAVETIILSGIIISSFISSLISLAIALSGDDLQQILFWLMGSVGMRGWTYIFMFLPFAIIGSVLLLTHHRELNAFALGEQSAHHLGLHVQRRKVLILVGASLLTGAAVSVSGMIGFVGLVIPHFVRLLIGPNHRHLLILAIIWGGTFLVVADLTARTVIAPRELPIGVITSIIGAPVFALLLMREKIRKGMKS